MAIKCRMVRNTPSSMQGLSAMTNSHWGSKSHRLCVRSWENDLLWGRLTCKGLNHRKPFPKPYSFNHCTTLQLGWRAGGGVGKISGSIYSFFRSGTHTLKKEMLIYHQAFPLSLHVPNHTPGQGSIKYLYLLCASPAHDCIQASKWDSSGL